MYENKYHTTDLSKYRFLITGGAGFIGSNLVQYLLKNGAGAVRVLDNFSTGYPRNIEEFKKHASFELIEGDIRDSETVMKCVEGVDYVSHQAALGSVPRSIADPLTTNDVNITGFLNVLYAVKQNTNIKRFVYAASSSTYGDSKVLPKVEDVIGQPLSPYAVTKYVNELYANVFAKVYNTESIGLRYFNVFGPKQSPEGQYAAVIPKFINAVMNDQPAFINGDGEHSRDFTFVENAVQANIKAFFVNDAKALNQVYNIACGGNSSINQLWLMINEIAGKNIAPVYQKERQGDVKHSKAQITKAAEMLGYQPFLDLKAQLKCTFDSFK